MRALFIGAMVVASLVAAWILLIHIPHHEAFFVELNARLPGLTVLMLGISRFTQQWGILLLLITLAVLIGLPLLFRAQQAAFLLAAGLWICGCLLVAGLGYLAIELPLCELRQHLYVAPPPGTQP